MEERAVRATYNRLRKKYFPDSHLPDWGDLQFRWLHCNSIGQVIVSDGETDVTLNQKIAWSSRLVVGTMLHEMIHMQGRPYLTHGRAFWMDVDRIYKLGALREFF